MRALITGGTRGIGYAIAQKLLKEGYEVTVTGTKKKGKGPVGSAYVSCDFEKASDLVKLSNVILKNRWDVLVNNAGINKIGSIDKYEVKDFERIQKINVTAPFQLMKAAIPGMAKRKYGRILNITSIFGVVSKEGRSAYSTSKFGLFGMSRALALENASKNVLINCLAPGFIDTDMTRRILGKKGMAQVGKRIPAGRFAKPEEIAAWAKFTVSKENTYMTGQNIVVDGGFTSA